MKISITYFKYKLELDIKDKITVIAGNGATGKTTMIYTLFKKDRQKIKWNISDKRFNGIILNSNRDIDDSIEIKRKNVVYFMDESVVTISSRLIELIKESVNCYFILVRRTRFDSINYSASSLLELKTTNDITYGETLLGKSRSVELDRFTDFDFVLLEDLKYGCEWWRRLMIKSKAKFIVAGGVDINGNILSEVILNNNKYEVKLLNNKVKKQDLGGKAKIANTLRGISKIKSTATVLLVVDYCSFGSSIDIIRDIIRLSDLDVTYFYNYKSWEYCILKSNVFKEEFKEYGIYNTGFEEEFYENQLAELSANTHMSVNHSNQGNLPYCYYEKCCPYKEYDGCKRGLSGSEDKYVSMFDNTEFSELLFMSGRKV